MGWHTRDPIGDVLLGTETKWSYFPVSPANWYSKVDESIPLKNTSDYWYAIDLATAKRNTVDFPDESHADLEFPITTLRVVLYWKATDITDTPAIRFRLYYDGSFQESLNRTVGTSGAWKLGYVDFSVSLSQSQYEQLYLQLVATVDAGYDPVPELIE